MTPLDSFASNGAGVDLEVPLAGVFNHSVLSYHIYLDFSWVLKLLFNLVGDVAGHLARFNSQSLQGKFSHCCLKILFSVSAIGLLSTMSPSSSSIDINPIRSFP